MAEGEQFIQGPGHREDGNREDYVHQRPDGELYA